MKYGFTKIAAATPLTTVADCKSNSKEIISTINKISSEEVEILLLPELCTTSCSCGDLFLQPFFIKKAEDSLQEIIEASKQTETIIIIGIPVLHTNNLYNSAAVIHKGRIVGINTKTHPQKGEERWFANSSSLPDNATTTLCGQEVKIGENIIYETPSCRFGIEIGSDHFAPHPTSCNAIMSGADIIFNPSAMSEEAGLTDIKQISLKSQSRRYICAYAHANSGYGESTSKATFSGYNAIVEKGTILAESKRFATIGQYSISEIDTEKLRKERRSSKLFTTNNNCEIIKIAQKPFENSTITRTFNPTPFIPSQKNADSRYEEIFMIQSMGLAKRITHTQSKSSVIGISGGLDSTLALLVTAKAHDIIGSPRCNIIAVTMPGFGTSDRTYNNALKLMKEIGVTMREISIKEACIQHFKDIKHDIHTHDVTYENSQARERTQILMDIANQCSGIVIGTGDLSELALGWATYNGDHMSMYGVNASVPKTLIQHIVRWVANNSTEEEVRTTLLDIVDTPISPELTPADEQGNIKQKTEDLVGPYELHDFFLYNFIRYGFSPAKLHFMAQKAFEGTYKSETIKKWLTTFLRRFFTQQFKRSCMPDSPKTGNCNLSPQEGWTMPSDTSFAEWLKECDNL